MAKYAHYIHCITSIVKAREKPGLPQNNPEEVSGFQSPQHLGFSGKTPSLKTDDSVIGVFVITPIINNGL